MHTTRTTVATASAAGPAPRAASELVRELTKGLCGASPALVMVFASTEQPLAMLAPIVAAAFPSAKVLGASTAGEFTERGDTKGAVCAVAVAGGMQVFAGMATGLGADPARAVRQAIEGLPSGLMGYPHRTSILLVDTMAGKSEEATLMAAAAMGAGHPLVGGAAGDDLKMRATFVSCGAHASSDAVVVAQIFTKAPLGVGVCHGHRPHSAPLRITRAKGNVVFEIEGRPAWDVWRERTRDVARAHGIDVDALGASDEGRFLLRFEAGLAAPEGGAVKIRAPLARTQDGAIRFSCGIPEGAVIRITESTPSDQIASAREAARRARAKIEGGVVAGAIVFDCICRNLILGREFGTAVKAMADELGGAPLAGLETYGEIALDAGDMSGFHNTTSVVLAFPRGG